MVDIVLISLGAAGLAALKNLTEEGFKVTGFERNSYVGGLWRYTEEDRTSVLKTTIVNISKERAGDLLAIVLQALIKIRGALQTFPILKVSIDICSICKIRQLIGFTDVSSFPTGAEVARYLTDYCEHFNLQPRIRLNTAIRQITYDEECQKWVVGLEGETEEFFDKIIIAIGGITCLPNLPVIEGMEKFKGISIHSRAFKRPADFKEKRVLVVGFGNTAADTATQLAGVAEKVYLAHRHGAHVVWYP